MPFVLNDKAQLCLALPLAAQARKPRARHVFACVEALQLECEPLTPGCRIRVERKRSTLINLNVPDAI